MNRVRVGDSQGSMEENCRTLAKQKQTLIHHPFMHLSVTAIYLTAWSHHWRSLSNALSL